MNFSDLNWAWMNIFQSRSVRKSWLPRVEAILRRTGQDAGNDVLSAGGIVIDKSAHQATVDGRQMELSFKEFELLTYFLENQGIALSREKILNSVWNYDYFGDATYH